MIISLHFIKVCPLLCVLMCSRVQSIIIAAMAAMSFAVLSISRKLLIELIIGYYSVILSYVVLLHGYWHFGTAINKFSFAGKIPIHSVYRAMHFSAKRGIAIACRLSVRPSVRPSVCDVGGL